MARIFPPILEPTAVRSRAERALFPVLRDALDATYTIIHSARWYLPRADEKTPGENSEADFIILHPGKGILILEVKSGKVSYNPETGKWIVSDEQGSRSHKRGPLQQAQEHRYAVERALVRIDPAFKDITFGYCAAFPDSARVPGIDHANMPRHLVLDSSQLDDIQGWVERIYRHFGGESCRGGGESVVRLAVDALAGSPEFSTRLQAQLALMNRTIKALTEEQYRLLGWLRGERRAAIAGCAGSGKTLVAVELAMRLDRAQLRTLLLCHSVHLANHLQTLTRGTGLVVMDFESWVRHLSGSADSSATAEALWMTYLEPTDKELDGAFDQIWASTIGYDAIVVDEGQDFRDTWWLLVDAALKDRGSGWLYVFHDDNQSILPHRGILPITRSPFSLSRNCRNAGAIFELVQRLHPSPPMLAPELSGYGHVKHFDTSALGIRLSLTAALIDAVEQLGHNQLVVLTTEPDPVTDSILFGLDIPLEQVPRWQESVNEYLSEIATEAAYWTPPARDLPPLSDEAVPSPDDIQRVVDWSNPMETRVCSSWLQYQMADSWVQQLTWHRVEPGGLEIRELPRDHRRRIAALIRFFRSPTWANTLPNPRRLRLMPGGNSACGEGCLPLFTVASFKGCEADGVILFGDRVPAIANALVYIGISRARVLLNLVGPFDRIFPNGVS